jgi:hypothetical protein
VPQPSVPALRHSRNFTEDSYQEEFFLPVFYGFLLRTNTGNWIATVPRALNVASLVPFRKALGDAHQ